MKRKSWLIWVTVWLIIIIPFCLTILCSVPYADDFAMANRMLQREGNHLFKAIDLTNWFFIAWDGAWTVNFLEYLLNPLLFFGATGRGLGIEMLLFFIAFLICIYCFIRKSVVAFFKSTKTKMVNIIFTVFVVSFFNLSLFPEIFCWFVGSSYLWEAIISLAFMTCCLDCFSKPAKHFEVLGLCILGFAAGFSYLFDAFMAIFFIAILWTTEPSNKRKIINWLPLLFLTAGGVMAVFAPGNFVRHAQIDSTGLHFLPAAISATKNIILENYILVVNPLFITLIGCAFIFGIKYGEETLFSFKYPIVVTLGAFASEYFTCFPIALGYSSGDIPNRMHFVLDFVICITSFIMLFYLGAFCSIRKNWKIRIEKRVLLMVGILVGYLTLFEGQTVWAESPVRNLPWMRCVCEYSEVKAESNFWRDVLSEISSSDEEIVILKRNESFISNPTGLIKGTGITCDEKLWDNSVVATYYGKQSIKLLGE